MNVSGFRPDFILYSAVPIIIGYYLINTKKIKDKTYHFLWCVYTLTNCVFLLCTYGSFINRIAYLSWLMLPFVLLYPYTNINWSKQQNEYLRYIIWGHLGFSLFMFFIYDPITLFIFNSEDFWFGFSTLLKTNILFFILTFLLIVLVSGIVLIASKLLKKQSIYNIYLIILSSGLLFAYIQGNYLSGKLPLLDGSPIEWNKYNTQIIISYILIVLSLLINILIYTKNKKKYNKIISYAFIAIFVMLCTGL